MPNILSRLEQAANTNPAATLELLTELMQAYHDGLIIELPCKVGDTVYEIGIDCIEDQCPHWHEGSSTFRDDSCCTLDYDDSEKCKRYKVFSTIMTDKNCIFLNLDDFGKTVFLTRAEAERRLESEKK